MAKIHRVGAIELSEDLAFTRKSWIVERAGWALLAALLVAALLGAFGPGRISSRLAINSSGSLAVKYDRFGCFRTEEAVTVRLASRPEDGGRVSFWIAESFLEGVSIESIRPEPLEVRCDQDRTTFVFAAPAGAAKVIVRFDLIPEKPGRLAGRFGRAEEGVDVRQFVYP